MPDLPPPPVEVQAVVVHAPRLAPLGGEAAFSTVQIGPEDLKDNPRIDEVLKIAPGVSLFRRTSSASANPTTQGISLRSIAPSGAGRALVTLDGAPQNDPFGGWVIWSSLPPEGIDSVNIIRGAGAGPYGAGALTGVVELQERGTVNGIAAADVSAGSRDSYRGALVGGYGNLLITAETSHTDGYYAVRGADRGAADERLKTNDQVIAARLQGEIGGVQAAARVSAFGVQQDAGLRGARSNTTGFSGALTLAQPASQGVGGWRLQAWVRRSDLENSSAALAPDRSDTTPANDQYNTPATGWGVNAAIQGKAEALNWEIGTDVRLTSGTDHERSRYMNGAFTRNREVGGKTYVAGVYAEAAYDQGPWIVTGGVRLDRSKAYDAKRIERDLTNGAVLLDSHGADRTETTPAGRLGVRYSVNENLYLRTAAYAGFRPPTLNELHRPFRVGNDITEANPSLKPETLYGVEGGFGGEGPIKWAATLFWNDLKDPITNVTIGMGPGTFPIAGFVPDGGALRQRQNAGEIKAWGVETEASGQAAPWLAWRVAADYTHARVHGGATAPQLTGLRPAQTPRWTVTAGLNARPTDRITLSADARYESARWEDDLNSRLLKGGTMVDARAAWALDDTSEVYVAAENLFGEELAVAQNAGGVTSYAEPFTFRVGFAYRR
jgi:outer membrane receptor protein involved in Fe transport